MSAYVDLPCPPDVPSWFWVICPACDCFVDDRTHPRAEMRADGAPGHRDGAQ